jgi:ATP-dependent Clp protease ATP-binding subunit ClpA
VLSSVWDTLLGKNGKRPTMGGMLLRSALVTAWTRRHDTVRLEHLASALVDVSDVAKALEARGMHVADVEAVVAQLVDDLPSRDADAPDTEPTFDKALDPITNAAMVKGALSSARFIENIANALPSELGFLRRPLAASAPELGTTFDAPIAYGEKSGLTFEGWDVDLQKCLGLMQTLADTRWDSWQLGATHLFLALLGYKPYFATFKARRVDPAQVIRDLGERMPALRWDHRKRPEGLVPTIGPTLFAVILRAERHAAADASDVRLRHLLLALHAEPHLKESIDQLVG